MPSQHYIFVYRVLPSMVRQLGRQVLVDLQNPAFLETVWEMVGSELPENQRKGAEGFHTYPYRLNEEVFLNVVELPLPVKPPEAFYAGVVVRMKKLDDPKADETRYFTLELGLDISGASPSTTYFCESTEEAHCILGEHSTHSAQEFARAIAEICLGKQA